MPGTRPSVSTPSSSSQHADGISLEEMLAPDVEQKVIIPVLSGFAERDPPRRDGAPNVVNPTGKFVIGGPMGDAGLTGRRDHRRHVWRDGQARRWRVLPAGPVQVDRSAAYATRWVARTWSRRVARRCEVQVAYAIGRPSPWAYVETFGTETAPIDAIQKAITTVFDLRPAAIVHDLDLLRPIYLATAAYGHFGRTSADGVDGRSPGADQPSRRVAPRRRRLTPAERHRPGPEEPLQGHVLHR